MKKTLKERFFSKVECIPFHTCWEWIGAKSKKGYGSFWSGDYSIGTIETHRQSWIIHNGAIPNGMHVLHKCDNPSCVNPAHLFLGTNMDNVKDMRDKGRNVNPPIHIGEANPISILTEDQVKIIKNEWEGYKGQQAALARRFKVHRSTIYAIINGRNWKNIK
jgi:hypothetical protein